MTGKPSARSGPVSPGVIERWEGLRRLLPEPTPSHRLWAAEPGATPARLCEHTIWVRNEPSKYELSTLARLGTFYFGPTRRVVSWLRVFAVPGHGERLGQISQMITASTTDDSACDCRFVEQEGTFMRPARCSIVPLSSGLDLSQRIATSGQTGLVNIAPFSGS
jgi:hypothetical protein